MLDGLFGRRFSSKCKSSIKLIKTRIDVIRRKRNAMLKYLKKDIADLLANGLELNAYGRAGGLIVEMNLSYCYDSVEKFCGSIPRHLSVMQKQRECPEECREAVSTLMFAAARFADLPELRDLRHIFTERYENSMESFVNQEFVEKIALEPPTTDKKLQLMREIAREFSIKWDSKAFEQKLPKPTAFSQDQPKSHGSIHNPNNDGNRQHISRDNTAMKRDTQGVLSLGRYGLTNDGYKAHDREETVQRRDNRDMPSGGRQEHTDDSYKQHNGREEAVRKRDPQDVSSRGRQGLIDDGCKTHYDREETVRKRENQGISCRGRQEVIDNRHIPRYGEEETKRDNQHPSFPRRQELTDDGFKSRHNMDYAVPKRENNLDDLSHVDDGYQLHNGREDTAYKRDNLNISSHGRLEHSNRATKRKPKTDAKHIPFVGNDHNGPSNGADFTEKVTKEKQSMKPPHKNVIPPPYVKPNGGKSDHNKAPSSPPSYNRVIANERSERTQTGSDFVHSERGVDGPDKVNVHLEHIVDRCHQDDVGGVKPKPRSTRRRHVKLQPGQDYTGDPEGDELVKRKPSGRRREDARRGLQQVLEDDRDTRDKEERMMDRLLMHYSKKPSKFEPDRMVRAGQDAVDGGESQRRTSRVPPPTRALSLPPKPVTPDSSRGPTRASSFKPQMLSPAGHVHPKLPDYDDLADQLASLRGR